MRVSANEDGVCPTCGRGILKGSLIETDGQRAWHPACGAPKPSSSTPGTMAGAAAAARADFDGEGKQIYVEIGAWVPIGKIEIVARAIREARA